MRGAGSRGGRGGFSGAGRGGRPSNASRLLAASGTDPKQARLVFSATLSAGAGGSGALKLRVEGLTLEAPGGGAVRAGRSPAQPKRAAPSPSRTAAGEDEVEEDTNADGADADEVYAEGDGSECECEMKQACPYIDAFGRHVYPKAPPSSSSSSSSSDPVAPAHSPLPAPAPDAVAKKPKLQAADYESEEESADSDEEKEEEEEEEVSAASGLKTKRNKYTAEQRQDLVQRIQAAGPFQSKDAMKQINATKGFEKVTFEMIKRWSTPRVLQRKGKPVDIDFERRLMNALIVKKVTDDAGNMLPKEQVVVLANVAYQRRQFVEAAKAEQVKLAADSPAKHLRFSDGWVTGFLARNNLARRKVTTTIKHVEDIDTVRLADKRITDFIEARELGADQVCSMDAIMADQAPAYQYVPAAGHDRAKAPPVGGARFTLNVAVFADGNLAPPFIIIGNSVKTADATSSRVIRDLHREHLTEEEGWTFDTWQRELEIVTRKDKKEVITKHVFKRHYIWHAVTRAVITSQSKAWMDTAGMAQWHDLVAVPFSLKLGKEILVISDNCGSHKTKAVSDLFAASSAEHRVSMMHFSANLTSEKQVCDIAINGSLKARMVKQRIDRAYDDMVRFRAEYAKHPTTAKFVPTPVSTVDAMKMLFATWRSYREDRNFKEGITRTFVKVGYLKDSVTGTYAQWTGNGHALAAPNKSFFPDKLEATDAFTFGDLVTTTAFERREGDEVVDDVEEAGDDRDEEDI